MTTIDDYVFRYALIKLIREIFPGFSKIDLLILVSTFIIKKRVR